MNDHDEYANLSNLKYIENLYSQYLENPDTVEKSWRYFFQGMDLGSSLQGPSSSQKESPDLRVFHLIEAYRNYGHKAARFNPIATESTLTEEVAELKLETLKFQSSELTQIFPTCGFLKEASAPLKKIVEALQTTYCGNVGFEYMGMQTLEMEQYLQEKIEPFFHFPLSIEEKIEVLKGLNQSEIMESFIHMKFPGQKRFSLEGGETLIPMMLELIEEGAEEGVEQIVLGMAHRGRLNVLANILGKTYVEIFREFEKTYMPDTFEGSGDVKYHKGYTASLSTKKGKHVGVVLCANPSHLEAVDPVVEGNARAKQEFLYEGKTEKTLPILIHGDASIAGQGVVYETLQLSKLRGYSTGGTLHIVINNQVGFTANPQETKSTRYSTDIAKSFGAPVFHVNAEDPENCYTVTQLAIQIRQRFKCDVFIELNCHRKFGHNETDEPAYTQPKIYRLIKQKKNIRNLYRDRLLEEGSLTHEAAEALEKTFKNSLEEALLFTQGSCRVPKVREEKTPLERVNTAVTLERLKALAQKFCTLPEDFTPNSKLKRLLQDRLKMLEDPQASHLDWGMAEYLAYASLVTENIPVRLSGQDSGRGTFSHRHALFTDQETEKRYTPLSHLSNTQAPFNVYNSPLSEYAVMGFEYGYSLACPNGLTIWEAQFGDFSNGAQIVIDQFIVAAQQKWGTTSSLTLLLPHGYEGQGPEHSSARMERFLQLAGNENLFVVNPSTPAQLFHVLRRQGLSTCYKPLIIFTPKALLRYPPSLSKPKALINGQFEEILDDPRSTKNVKRLIFCSGHVYYDLIENCKREDIAFIRIEQLYPFNNEKVEEILKKYGMAQEFFWVQEEHRNQGAWSYVSPLLQNLLPEKLSLRYVGRERSASTAAGSGALHKAQVEQLLKEALE